MPEVRGSSPLSSTPPPDGPQVVGAHQFREHFGFWLEQAAAGLQLTVTRRGRPHVQLGPAVHSQP